MAELEPAEPELVAKKDDEPQSKADRLGLVVRELTDEEIARARANRERRGMDPEDIPEGLLVERVQGAARDAGVQRGDFILNVNNKPVRSVKEFSDAVDKAGSSVALLVQRRGAQIFIPVRTR